jgi:hypothetical protein
MYFVAVILFLFVLPVASIVLEALFFPHAETYMFLIGKWFVFWSVGIRLLAAGARQVFQPRFTAEEIFDIHEPLSFAIIREVGFANLSMGFLGVSTVVRVEWLVPAAIVGGLYYGLAGLGHAFRKDKNAHENMAMFSDAFIFVVLLIFVINSLD